MAGIRKTVHGRESFPPMHGIPQPHSGRPVNGLFGPNDIGAERVEARIDVLITAVNLLHILDDAAPLRTQGGDKERYPGTDVGRVCRKALQDAKPTKHTQPFTMGKGFGVRVREFALSL